MRAPRARSVGPAVVPLAGGALVGARLVPLSRPDISERPAPTYWAAQPDHLAHEGEGLFAMAMVTAGDVNDSGDVLPRSSNAPAWRIWTARLWATWAFGSSSGYLRLNSLKQWGSASTLSETGSRGVDILTDRHSDCCGLPPGIRGSSERILRQRPHGSVGDREVPGLLPPARASSKRGNQKLCADQLCYPVFRELGDPGLLSPFELSNVRPISSTGTTTLS